MNIPNTINHMLITINRMLDFAIILLVAIYVCLFVATKTPLEKPLFEIIWKPLLQKHLKEPLGKEVEHLKELLGKEVEEIKISLFQQWLLQEIDPKKHFVYACPGYALEKMDGKMEKICPEKDTLVVCLKYNSNEDMNETFEQLMQANDSNNKIDQSKGTCTLEEDILDRFILDQASEFLDDFKGDDDTGPFYVCAPFKWEFF